MLRFTNQEHIMSDHSDDFRQADGRFAQGNPGGPGRPRARERAAALDALAAEAGAELIEVALSEAKKGNLRAVELLLDRIWPVRRGRPVEVDAPPIRTIPDLVPAGAAVTSAVLSGDLTPQEGAAAARVLVAHNQMISTALLEPRLQELEKTMKPRRSPRWEPPK
jgi:hypothetical protein